MSSRSLVTFACIVSSCASGAVWAAPPAAPRATSRIRSDGACGRLGGDREARRRTERRRVGEGRPDSRVRPARSEGRRGAHVRNRGPGAVRPWLPVHRRQGVRRRPSEDCRPPHPPRRGVAVRLDSRDDRLLPRPADRVRVRGQPRRRQAGPLLVRRFERRSELGRRLGRRRQARRQRLERRIPHPVLSTSLRAGQRRHVRVRRPAGDWKAERDVLVAADRQEQTRIRLADGRTGRAEARRGDQATRGRALHGRAGPVAASRGRRSVREVARPVRDDRAGF